MQKGQIFKIHSDFYYIDSNGVTFECKLREVLKKQKQKVFVGDLVEFENGAITKILPRENYITRPTVLQNIIILKQYFVLTKMIYLTTTKPSKKFFPSTNRLILISYSHLLSKVTELTTSKKF